MLIRDKASGAGVLDSDLASGTVVQGDDDGPGACEIGTGEGPGAGVLGCHTGVGVQGSQEGPGEHKSLDSSLGEPHDVDDAKCLSLGSVLGVLWMGYKSSSDFWTSLEASIKHTAWFTV